MSPDFAADHNTWGVVPGPLAPKGGVAPPYADVKEAVAQVLAAVQRNLPATFAPPPIEEVVAAIRQHRPEVVIHMATITHFSARAEERLRINLHGTRLVFDYCHEFGVKQVVFVGRHTIYGAAPDAPLYRTEDEPPLAVSTFPELADLVAADLYAGSALWRWPELKTAVLRLVYLLGPARRGTLANLLDGKRVPMILGFDPLFQFMHEYDVVSAICLALEAKIRGVYNVAGDGALSIHQIAARMGKRCRVLPAGLLRSGLWLLKKLGLTQYGPEQLDFLRYRPVLLNTRLKEEFGYTPKLSSAQVFELYRASRQTPAP